ncbi:hypothetical protein HMPREF0880_03589 [Yokenella regensburgei ATCC 43003]|nr:hypothetical protein HMPREF0880_03589 [Yokenella regensburgei ATCC 43003]
MAKQHCLAPCPGSQCANLAEVLWFHYQQKVILACHLLRQTSGNMPLQRQAAPQRYMLRQRIRLVGGYGDSASRIHPQIATRAPQQTLSYR